jgi:hypothetical protein
MASRAGTLSFCTRVRSGYQCIGPRLPSHRPSSPPQTAYLCVGHLNEGAQSCLHVSFLPGGEQAEALQQPQLGLTHGRVWEELTQQLFSSAHALLLGFFPMGRQSCGGGILGPHMAFSRVPPAYLLSFAWPSKASPPTLSLSGFRQICTM